MKHSLAFVTACAACAAPARPPGAIHVYHGVAVADPYGWLEDAGSPATVAWVHARDAAGRAALARLPERESLLAEIAAAAASERTLAPARGGSRLFFFRGDAALTQPSLMVSDAGRPPRVLADGSALAARGELLCLVAWPRVDGARVAYGVGRRESRHCEVRIHDLDRNADLGDRVPGVRRARPLVVWTAEGDGLSYVDADGAAVRLHRLGAPRDADPVLFSAEGGEITGLWRRDHELIVATLRDGRSRVVRVDGDGRPQPLIAPGDGSFAYVGPDGDALLFYTTRGAPRGRVVRLRPDGVLDDVVPENEWVIDTWSGAGNMVSLAGDSLFVVYRDGQLARLRQHDRRGRRVRDIPLPAAGSIWSGLLGQPEDPELFFSLSGFVDPGTVYRIDARSGGLGTFARPTLPYDPNEIVTEVHRYPSPAGFAVPILLARHRDTRPDGRRPVLAYGYGWGGWIAGPWFRPHVHAFLRRGGVFALPALRGGGELGEDWQRAGTGRNRANAIADYLAAMRWLVDAGWTAPGRIVAEGQSAGASLVAAAVLEQSDLFGAVLLAHPVLDMLRYEQHPGTRHWRSEFGTVSDADDFRALRAWSPLHNLRRGACYPATLVMPSELDPTAAPFHGTKYAAALADAQGCAHPVLLRVAWGAGHAYGKDSRDTVASYVDQLAFALAMTRL